MIILYQILNTFITVLIFLMLARAISSWFVRDLSNPIIRFLHEVTEPMVAPVRNLLHKMGLGGGMIDFSFIIVYIILMVLQDLLRVILL